MAEFDQERAIARYTELMRLIQVGAYQERGPEHYQTGTWPEDGVEKGINELEYRAALQSLEFCWHQDSKTYTLEPMTGEAARAFIRATQENTESLIASLPSGVEHNVRINYQSHGDLLPSAAIRHWVEIPGTSAGSSSQWTCDGYASSRQYAGMIAESLHKTLGHAYEVWFLRPFGNSPGPHILDFVPALHTDPAKYKGDRAEPTELAIEDFSEQWVIAHYGIHESNHQYVKALAVTFPTHNQVYTCRVQFSQSGEQVTLQMHNLPGGLNVFSLRYDLAESEG